MFLPASLPELSPRGGCPALPSRSLAAARTAVPRRSRQGAAPAGPREPLRGPAFGGAAGSWRLPLLRDSSSGKALFSFCFTSFAASEGLFLSPVCLRFSSWGLFVPPACFRLQFGSLSPASFRLQLICSSSLFPCLVGLWLQFISALARYCLCFFKLSWFLTGPQINRYHNLNMKRHNCTLSKDGTKLLGPMQVDLQPLVGFPTGAPVLVPTVRKIHKRQKFMSIQERQKSAAILFE